MSKITEYPLRNKTNTFFIAGDWHSTHVSEKALEFMLEEASHEKNPVLIINGDFFDAPYFMPKNEMFQRWFKRQDGIEEFFIPMFEEEMKWCNDTLDGLQSMFKDIIYVDGNHCEVRAKNFRNKYCPEAYKHNFFSYEAMNLKKRKIKYVIEYNDWLDIGDLSITHGMWHATTAAKRHYEASGGRDVMYSHVHRYQDTPFVSRGKTKHVISLPAFCHLNPDYMKNSDNNWDEGYGKIIFKKSGEFFFHPRILNNGDLIL